MALPGSFSLKNPTSTFTPTAGSLNPTWSTFFDRLAMANDPNATGTEAYQQQQDALTASQQGESFANATARSNRGTVLDDGSIPGGGKTGGLRAGGAPSGGAYQPPSVAALQSQPQTASAAAISAGMPGTGGPAVEVPPPAPASSLMSIGGGSESVSAAPVLRSGPNPLRQGMGQRIPPSLAALLRPKVY